jgi:hypothetical protein
MQVVQSAPLPLSKLLLFVTLFTHPVASAEQRRHANWYEAHDLEGDEGNLDTRVFSHFVNFH